MSNSLIQLQSVSLKNGTSTLFDSLDWEISRGQVWAVLGVNGCGKSTLLRWLAGLTLPDALRMEGSLSWNIGTLNSMTRKQRAKFMAWMPQSDSHAFECSVTERLMASLYTQGHPLGWETQADWTRVRETLEAFDLQHLINRTLNQLSGGERRRVAIAAAQMQDAEVTLLDEPLSQLDWAHQVQIGRSFRQWPDLPHKAIVWVTHEPNMAFRFATHLLMIDLDGRVMQGAACDMANPELLAKVYGCEIESSFDPFLFYPKA